MNLAGDQAGTEIDTVVEAHQEGVGIADTFVTGFARTSWVMCHSQFPDNINPFAHVSRTKIMYRERPRELT